ncbi:hypothetical protein BI292_24665 [Pseudomonas sp. 43NM1]|nr:hypothetical protein BI292_24665 [Pseudomonas sp. 43NM1]
MIEVAGMAATGATGTTTGAAAAEIIAADAVTTTAGTVAVAEAITVNRRIQKSGASSAAFFCVDFQ